MQEEIVHSYVQSYSHNPLLVSLSTSGATLDQQENYQMYFCHVAVTLRSLIL